MPVVIAIRGANHGVDNQHVTSDRRRNINIRHTFFSNRRIACNGTTSANQYRDQSFSYRTEGNGEYANILYKKKNTSGKNRRYINRRNSNQVNFNSIRRSLQNARTVTSIGRNSQEARPNRRWYLFGDQVAATCSRSELIPRRRTVTNNTMQSTVSKRLLFTERPGLAR